MSTIPESQWEAHRDTIGALYCEQGKTLAEVMEIMRREHDFHASTKMYKYRIAKWGLRKYLKADEARSIMRRIEKGQTIELPIVQGRQLGSKEFKAKTDQASKLRRMVRQHMLRQGLNGRIEAPEILYRSESALFFVRINTFEKISSGPSFYLVPGVQESWGEIDRSSMWWADMRSAADEIKQGHCSPSGFATLNSCFERYASIPATEDFPVAWLTYTSMLLLYDIGEDLGNLYGRYLVELSTIRYGQSHPHTRRWAEILKLDANIRAEAISSIIHTEFSLALENTAPESPFWIAITALSLGYSCSQGIISLESGVARLSEPVARRRGAKSDKSLIYPTASIAASIQAAYIGKKSASLSWGEVTLQILLRLSQNPLIPPENIVDGLWLLAGTLDCIDPTSGSERYLMAALNILHREAPDDHLRIGMVYSKLAYVRSRRGDIEGAEAARLLNSRWISAEPPLIPTGVSFRWLFLGRIGNDSTSQLARSPSSCSSRDRKSSGSP